MYLIFSARIFGNFKQRTKTYDLRDKILVDSDPVISVAMTLGYRVQFIAQNNVEMISDCMISDCMDEM